MSLSNYDKSSFILPMDGSNSGTTFTDWSPIAKTVTANGNAQTSTAQYKYYGSSGLFDGTGDYLTINGTSSLALPGDFTLGAWVRFNSISTNQPIISKWGGSTSSNNSFIFYYSQAAGALAFDFRKNDGATYISTVRVSWTPSLSIWYFVIITRASNIYRFFVDGVQIGANITETSIVNTGTTNILVAAYDTTAFVYASSNMNDAFLINGVALWTANFTPPTRLIGTITGNVKDINNNNASRIITACPRTNPTRSFSTISDAGTGNYTLRVPATEVSRIALADEVTLYNDIVDRILVV